MDNNKPIIITCLVLFLTVCLVLSCVALCGAGFWLTNTGISFLNEQPLELPFPQNSSPEAPLLEPEDAPDPAESDSASGSTPSQGEALDPEITRQMDEIQLFFH